MGAPSTEFCFDPFFGPRLGGPTAPHGFKGCASALWLSANIRPGPYSVPKSRTRSCSGRQQSVHPVSLSWSSRAQAPGITAHHKETMILTALRTAFTLQLLVSLSMSLGQNIFRAWLFPPCHQILVGQIAILDSSLSTPSKNGQECISHVHWADFIDNVKSL